MWRDATRCPDGFRAPGWKVVAADGHLAAPAGWVGVVQVLGSVVVAAPSGIAGRLSQLLMNATSVDQLTSPGAASALYGPFRQTLGPALLLYGGMKGQPGPTPAVLGPLSNDDPRVLEVLDQAASDEVDESGLTDTTSGVFVAVDAGRPVAACAWRRWPHSIAHFSVITAAEHRNRGFARAAATTALGVAIDAGLLPQWRAAETNPGSIALAVSLGLKPVGRQFSVLIPTAK